MAPVLVAPADATTAQIVGSRDRAERVAGEAVGVVARDLDDGEVEQRGGGADRRVGRRRGRDGEATGVGMAPPPRVAGDGQRAQVAGRPTGHEAAARRPSGSPASERSQSSATSSAATAPPASCQLSPENDHAPTRASNSAAVVAGAAGM